MFEQIVLGKTSTGKDITLRTDPTFFNLWTAQEHREVINTLNQRLSFWYPLFLENFANEERRKELGPIVESYHTALKYHLKRASPRLEEILKFAFG